MHYKPGCVYRFNDVSPSVRIECIRHSKYFLAYHPHLADDVTQLLHDRFHDKDDKVRMECVKVVSEAAADNPKAVLQRVNLVINLTQDCRLTYIFLLAHG